MAKAKNKIPTKAEVKKEIDTLKEYKPRIVRFGTFGNDNHAKIDAEIEVMNAYVTHGNLMDDADIDEKVDEGDWDEDEASAARDVVSWLEGNGCEVGEVPSDNWKSLVK